MNKYFPKPAVFSLLSLLICLFALTISFSSVNTLTAQATSKLPTIKSINIPFVTVNQNSKYKLPLKLTATLTSNTKKSVAVIWNKKIVYANTGIIGTSYYYGKVSGYSKQIKFTLKIIPYVVSIEEVNLTLKQFEIYPLPIFLTAKLSNNTYKGIPVSWESNTINTNKPIAYKILGKAKGYSKPVGLNIVVSPIITNIPDLNITVKQYETYSLPEKVQASYSDDTTKSVAINWSADTFKTESEGKFVYHGSVDGYDKPITINITILPVKLVSLSANNGNLILQFSNSPTPTLSAADLSLTCTAISSTTEISDIPIGSITVDPSDVTSARYKITFKPLTPGFVNKSVTFNVSYKNGSKLASNSFLLPMVESTNDSFDAKVSDKIQFYNAVKYALANFNDSIELNIKNFNDEDYNLDIVDKVLYENPEIDYSYYACSSNTGSTDVNGYTKYLLTLKYKLTKDQMLKEKTAVDNKVKEILTGTITPGMTDYQKELAIHNYIIKNAEYDKLALKNEEPIESHNSYGVLVLGIGVCESYAKALSLLLSEVGLEEKYVIGDANDGSGAVGHAWNMVKLDGEWYHVDATWDDPITSSGSSLIKHDYFNVTDKMIGKDHIVDEKLIDFPDCTGTKYYFFNMNGPEYDRYQNPMIFINNITEFKAAIASTLNKRSTSLSLVLLNSSTQNYDLDLAINEIVSNRYPLRAGWYDDNSPVDINVKYLEIQFSY